LRPLLLLLLFISGSITANGWRSDTVYVHPDSLAEKNILLHQPWRFHSGDDSTWREPDFDHSDWDTLRPIMHTLEEMRDNWQGRGWFRKVLRVDSSYYGQPIAATITHYGASELYLNGRLVNRHGKIENDTIRIYNSRGTPFVFLLDSLSEQVLALRYANLLAADDPLFFGRFIDHGYAGFYFYLAEPDQAITTAISNRFSNTIFNAFVSGMFAALASLHFLLFLFYQRRREHLFYAVFTIGVFIILFANPIDYAFRTSLDAMFYTKLAVMSAFVFLFAGYLAFLYYIFYQRIPRWGWYFFTLIPIFYGFLFFATHDYYLSVFLAVYVLLMSVEGLRIIIVALHKGKRDTWLLGAGVAVFFLFLLTIIVVNAFTIRLPNYVNVPLFLGGLFSLPISMSIYLARGIARTNRDLEKQLQTVRDLSSRQLEQEKQNSELQLQAEKARAAHAEERLRTAAAEAQARAITAENERKTRELEQARELQLSMLPRQVPELNGYEIFTYMKTATEVGGDYYDFFKLDNEHLKIAIGDATGHGMQAGTLVTATKSLFVADAGKKDLQEQIATMNASIRGLNLRFLFMCLQIVEISGRQLRSLSAGIPPMLIYRKQSNTVEEIMQRGLPLGSVKQPEYEIFETALDVGDIILLLSDGLPELLDSKGEMFGYERLTSEFHITAAAGESSIIAHLVDKAEEWHPLAAANDDISLIVIKCK
jgi:serine phosphatase RsbU (regulator of sigma subunit)